MVDTHTEGANFALMGLGMGRGEGYLFESLFEQTEPAGAGRREQAAGFNSRCQPHPTAADESEGQRRCWWVSGEICGGRQAGEEFREPRGILPLT